MPGKVLLNNWEWEDQETGRAEVIIDLLKPSGNFAYDQV
jgi:hypothetical protein